MKSYQQCSEWVGKIALFGKLWSERRLVGLNNVCNEFYDKNKFLSFFFYYNFVSPKNDRWRNFMPMVFEEGASASSLFFRASSPQKQAKELPLAHIVR